MVRSGGLWRAVADLWQDMSDLLQDVENVDLWQVVTSYSDL